MLTPQLQFYDRFGEDPDIVVNDITVLDLKLRTNGVVKCRRSGFRDVLIETLMTVSA